MPNLKEVKNRINSVKSTQQITKAMKMVAASKLRKAQEQITNMRPYSQKLSEIIANITSSLTSSFSSEYAEEREVKNVLIVVVTSDKGLCGAFNSSVVKKTNALVNEKYAHLYEQGGVKLLPLGKRGLDFFKKREYPLITDYSDIFKRLDFEDTREVAAYIMNSFKSGEFDKVEVIYNEFKNAATQILRVDQFLPIAKLQSEEGSDETDYIFEPSTEEMLSDLIPTSLRVKFFTYLLESNASEHGARMTAMDKATDNADDLIRELQLTYNRTRQAAITKEILEIVGGAEALAQQG